MNEIKKCPHCGQDAHIQINITNSYVDVQLLCNGCDAIFKCSEHLDKDKSIPKAVNECFIDVFERWNERVEEPQERKESNIEWMLNGVKKGNFNLDVCRIAHRAKWGIPCTGDCNECEFKNNWYAVDYLLEQFEG